jgi:hypothetical protein
MAIALYKDALKTILLDQIEFFTGDGTTKRYMATYGVVSVYIDDVKTTKFRTIDGLIVFDTPPPAASTVVLVPNNCLSFQLPSDQAGNTVESLWMDTDQDVYLLSVDTEDLGELVFSTDNISFFSSIQVLTGTDIQIYVKASLAAPLNEVKTIARDRIVVVSSSTPIDSNGNMTVNFTVGGGKYGGVEIHEELV